MRGSALQPDDLIAVARVLARGSRGKPVQAALRRAVSTTYYALFHMAARNCSDMLIGTSRQLRSNHAWIEVYRSLAHGTARAACEDKGVIDRFPAGVVDFAALFAEMQVKRHSADYGPTARFYRSVVLADINRAERVMGQFAEAKPKDKRAFASWLLFRHATARARARS